MSRTAPRTPPEISQRPRQQTARTVRDLREGAGPEAGHTRVSWRFFLVGVLLSAGCWVKDAEVRRKIEAADRQEETGDTGEDQET
jgi:hypothetical protein